MVLDPSRRGPNADASHPLVHYTVELSAFLM